MNNTIERFLRLFGTICITLGAGVLLGPLWVLVPAAFIASTK